MSDTIKVELATEDIESLSKRISHMIFCKEQVEMAKKYYIKSANEQIQTYDDEIKQIARLLDDGFKEVNVTVQEELVL